MKNLKNTLLKIAALNITDNLTLAEHCELHDAFFLDLDHFITHIVFRSKANINHLLELTGTYGMDADDIRFDCLERCVTKLDLVLAKEPEAQIPYMYNICNNVIIDCFRSAVKYALTTVSLNEEINRHDGKDDSRNTKSFEDYTMDTKANTESDFIARSQVLDLIYKYSDNADSLLCAVATKIAGDKPAELANVIISAGSVKKALDLYLKDIEEEFHIDSNELPPLPRIKHTGLSKLLLNASPASSRVISSKISNILNRTR